MTAGSDDPDGEADGPPTTPERPSENGTHPPEDGRRDEGSRPDRAGSSAAADPSVEELQAAEPPDAVDEEGWRFSLEDLEAAAEDPEDEGNVAGILMRDEPLEKQSIDLENAIFFLVGALGTVVFIVLAVAGI